ncbi:hypothetical protein LCI18_008440 [Fusarium solani-melongenae]|uniref:Uncharacterized protein n=1 Tax=Fusarium solani subsp. cucurbitae TaxID=2747967 RepID=A0ACD3Z8E1_FUSSC|nr:hypothetical protein LCI18_008440 [Fusarium solani-melongenae]
MAGLRNNSYAAVSITWGAALIAVVLRIYARRLTKQAWWFDDYFCISAFVFGSAYNSIIVVWTVDWYLGQELDPTLSDQQREHILLYNRLLMLCTEYCYAFSIASSKFTILSLYWRLFKHSSIRLPIQIMLTASLAWILLRIFMVSLQCIPLKYFWDKSIDGRCGIDESQFFFGTVLTHFVMDIIILILPVVEVGKLHLRLGQKLAVICLFLIGSIVCLASIFVLIESITYDEKTTQMPRDVALNFIWGDVEVNVAIISSCFPLLRPVFRRILPKSFLSSHGSRHPTSRATRSRHIKLATIHTIRTNKEKGVDESSSTHQLGDLEQGYGAEPIQTVISSHLRSSRSSSSGERDMEGIHVTNDMVVKVEPACHIRG